MRCDQRPFLLILMALLLGCDGILQSSPVFDSAATEGGSDIADAAVEQGRPSDASASDSTNSASDSTAKIAFHARHR